MLLCPKGHLMYEMAVSEYGYYHWKPHECYTFRFGPKTTPIRLLSLRYACSICRNIISSVKHTYICHGCRYVLCPFCYNKELNDNKHIGIGILKYNTHNVDICDSNKSRYYNPLIATSYQNDNFCRITTSNNDYQTKYKWYDCSLDVIHTDLNSIYWYKASKLIVKIIENVIVKRKYDKHSNGYIRRKKYETIDYFKVAIKLEKYCNHHPCYRKFLYLLETLQFSLKYKGDPNLWKFVYGYSHAHQCGETLNIYCKLKWMIHGCFAIYIGTLDQQIHLKCIVTNTASVIVHRFCMKYASDTIGMIDNLIELILLFFGQFEINEFVDNDATQMQFEKMLFNFYADPTQKEQNNKLMCIKPKQSKYVFIFFNMMPLVRKNRKSKRKYDYDYNYEKMKNEATRDLYLYDDYDDNSSSSCFNPEYVGPGF